MGSQNPVIAFNRHIYNLGEILLIRLRRAYKRQLVAFPGVHGHDDPLVFRNGACGCIGVIHGKIHSLTHDNLAIDRHGIEVLIEAERRQYCNNASIGRPPYSNGSIRFFTINRCKKRHESEKSEQRGKDGGMGQGLQFFQRLIGHGKVKTQQGRH
ncbi:MAG: hypothetical protein BWY09_02833 [Candidatus Hydrogenedentes bacterium ADurb.Bin179]|nr:MAG: hypothetical protein BWY09_02833 [Candidatus Hydrogenedentes bacterium ADurb.Bin179]